MAVFRKLCARLDVVAFAGAVLFATFGYGVVVGKMNVFPHQFLNVAFDAAKDWRDNWRHYLGIRSKWLQPTDRTEAVVSYDPDAAWNGYTFVTAYRDGYFGAHLIDMEGAILHSWRPPLEAIWADLNDGEPLVPEIEIAVHGAALLPEGEVLLVLAGGAMAKLDRCSSYLWGIANEVHHSVDLTESGDIVTLGAAKRTPAEKRFPRVDAAVTGTYVDETVMRVRPDGTMIDEFSALQVIYDSGDAALVIAANGSAFRSSVEDITHLNDAEELRSDMAGAFPQFEAGDLLLSFRNLNTIVVIDGTSHRIKWSMTGPFVGAHDPDFMPNGHILLYDNRITGGSPQLGYTRILEIDPVTRAIVWQYQGTDAEPMYASFGGKVQLLPNGNVLTLEPEAGRVIEIAREDDNRLVWDYVNLAEDGWAGESFDAIRVAPESVTFLGEGC